MRAYIYWLIFLSLYISLSYICISYTYMYKHNINIYVPNIPNAYTYICIRIIDNPYKYIWYIHIYNLYKYKYTFVYRVTVESKSFESGREAFQLIDCKDDFSKWAVVFCQMPMMAITVFWADKRYDLTHVLKESLWLFCLRKNNCRWKLQKELWGCCLRNLGERVVSLSRGDRMRYEKVWEAVKSWIQAGSGPTGVLVGSDAGSEKEGRSQRWLEGLGLRTCKDRVSFNSDGEGCVVGSLRWGGGQLPIHMGRFSAHRRYWKWLPRRGCR